MARKGSVKRQQRKRRKRELRDETRAEAALRVRAGMAAGAPAPRSQTFRDRRREADRKACRGRVTWE